MINIDNFSRIKVSDDYLCDTTNENPIKKIIGMVMI